MPTQLPHCADGKIDPREGKGLSQGPLAPGLCFFLVALRQGCQCVGYSGHVLLLTQLPERGRDYGVRSLQPLQLGLPPASDAC